jgi:hypothetical protein
MRSLRPILITISATIGLVAAFFTLCTLTGFLVGAVTPHSITVALATWANRISAAPLTWWLAALVGWVIVGWSSWLIFTLRMEAPVVVREDEIGTVEIAPEALASVARAEIMAQGSPRPIRAEFARKLGRPVLQIWTDLTTGGNGEGPLARGEKLKRDVERRLSEDFALDKVRVEVVHLPNQKSRVREKPVAVA